MRADRLIAVLMLLQRHGRITARRVSEELEISERTARRDLEALAVAGVPVYSTAGRGGGWELIGGARTDLSGLSAPEVRALFLAAGSVPGQPEAVTSALRKLLHAVPEPFRDEAAMAAEAVFVDNPGWGWGRGGDGRQGSGHDRPPLLEALQDAVVKGIQVDLDYRDRQGASTRRRVHPLGLVVRGRTWYLIADTEKGRRTFRVDRVVAAESTADPVERPDGFDLAEAWRAIVSELGAPPAAVVLHVVVDGWVVPILRRMLGPRLVAVGPPDGDGRHRVEVHGPSLDSTVGTLAGFGTHAEVVDPPEARAWLAALGAELAARYA